MVKAVISDKWILCPDCGAKTRTQILEDTELKHFPLFCPKCKKNFIIDVRNRIVEYQTYFKIKHLTSYLTVTIIASNRKVTYNIIRQTHRRSAYYLI